MKRKDREEMKNEIDNDTVKGYKVFEPDWTCRGKQYSCPGKFEKDVFPIVCRQGMHFCKEAVDCFNYYEFDPYNHVAEVIAYGEVVENNDKCCTNKLEIVREIPWTELLEMINTGKGCTGLNNSGNQNSGSRNSGNLNSGNCNYGHSNSGDYNSGYRNSGRFNGGHFNSGNYNSGNSNSGNYNSGHCNSGAHNKGSRNSGDWNECSFSNGCFNTIEPKIYMFNKPSEWTFSDWVISRAYAILNQMPIDALQLVYFEDMTDEERTKYPQAKTLGYYLRHYNDSDLTTFATAWWRELPSEDKEIIKALPNFDEEIFKQITGIDVKE